MSSGHKKVIIRKRNQEWTQGYLPATGFIENGHAPLLAQSGKVLPIALDDIKWICFVREFAPLDAQDPERLVRKTFQTKPRAEGLWLRLAILDDEAPLEGLAANNLSLLDVHGVLLTPPDTRSNTQRVFVPRSSVLGLEVRGVVVAKTKKEGDKDHKQPDLFREEPLLES